MATRTPLKVKQASAITGLSNYTMYTKSKDGTIPSYKIMGSVVWYEDELLEWMKSGKRKSKFEIETSVNNAITSHIK